MAPPRCEVIGECTLWLGRAEDVLPILGKVDAVITDPNYNIVSLGGMGKRRQYLSAITGVVDGGFDITLLDNFVNWFTFCGKQQIVSLIQYAEQRGLRWQLLTWNKTNPIPLTCGNYLPDTEYMIHAFRTHIWEHKSRFITGPIEKNDFDHPTVKPIYVMVKALKSASVPGDKVLDPYMGTGTTGIAALMLDRRFIGIEISEKYFAIACRRIEAAYKQQDFFLPRHPTHAPAQLALVAPERTTR